MAEVARLVLEAVLFERRRLRGGDRVLLVVVVLEGVLLLHEVLVLLELLVVVEGVVGVRQRPGQDGLGL